VGALGGLYPTLQSSSFACQSHSKPQNIINININYLGGRQACERQVLYPSIINDLIQFPTFSPQRKRVITFIFNQVSFGKEMDINKHFNVKHFKWFLIQIFQY